MAVMSKRNTLYSTASIAGRLPKLDWTTVRRHEVRVEELVKYQKELVDRGIMSPSDEVADARRRFQDLIGPTSIGKTKKEYRRKEVLEG